jgi:hypothetical protein
VSPTEKVLRGLADALTEIKTYWEHEGAGEELAGNVVKEGVCRGTAAGIQMTITAIHATLATNAAEAAEAAAHPMNKDYLRAAASAISDKLPDQHGFLLLVANYGEGGRLYYVSTMTRDTALNVLKEFLLKAGAAEDWMQHIK